MAPRGVDAINILKMRPEDRIYEGGRSDHGTFFFKRDIRWRKTSTKSLTPGQILAMGLTERCAEYGHGKVYYFAKEGNDAISGFAPRRTERHHSLPSLIYVQHEWSEQEKTEWFQEHHTSRLLLLNARNALPLTELSMPMTLTYADTSVQEIRFTIGMSRVVMTYDTAGHMHLGYYDEMLNTGEMFMQSRKGTFGRQLWIGQENDLVQYRVLISRQAVAKLQEMFLQNERGVLKFYKEIVLEAIQVHKECAAPGAYSIANDPCLGPDIEAKYRFTRGPGRQRMMELQNALNISWSAEQRKAYRDFRAIARSGVAESAIFVISDANFKTLTEEQRLLVVELWKLEKEAGVLDDGDSDSSGQANAEDDSSEDSVQRPGRQQAGGQRAGGTQGGQQQQARGGRGRGGRGRSRAGRGRAAGRGGRGGG